MPDLSVSHPRFPIYIPSLGRADTGQTARQLRAMGVRFRIIVEQAEHDEYAREFGVQNLLILDPEYQRTYETCDDLGTTKRVGPGAARNFAWEHSMREGYPWHWVMDDNIRSFKRLHQNQRREVTDGTMFHAMETFCLRYTNVAMAGPNYVTFAPHRTPRPPFQVGTRIYSCNLIRNDVPFRWRGRYNEDTILSLDMLTAGWNTVQFNAFLTEKNGTQIQQGGNTEAFYAKEGTYNKSKMLVDLYPEVTELVKRWDRWHHYVDYSQWRKRPLIRRDDLVIPDENPYAGLKLVDAPPRAMRFLDEQQIAKLKHGRSEHSGH